jgi:hypothetical protein
MLGDSFGGHDRSKSEECPEVVNPGGGAMVAETLFIRELMIVGI